MPITNPKHEPIKKVYVQMVKEVVGRQIMGTIDEYIKLPCTLRVQNGDSGRYIRGRLCGVIS